MNEKVALKISTLLGCIFGCLFVLGIIISLALLFPINPDKVQGWFSAWIHGVFWLPNWIISWFKDPWYIHAPLCCKSYNFWFWSGVVSSIWGIIFGVLLETIYIRKKMNELSD